VNRYDRFAERYNHLMLGGYYDYALQADALDALMPRGAPVLEIGVGTGLLAKALHDRGWAVAGIDHTEEMLVQARELLGPDVLLEQADATTFDLGQRYGVVISNGGVWYGVHDDEGEGFGYCGHLPTVDALRQSFDRVVAHLEPGGLLVLSLQDRHHDKLMELPDGVTYRQTITDRGREGPLAHIDKEYRFEREGQALLVTELRLTYADRDWFDAELADRGFGAPERTADRAYVGFRRG